MAMKGVDTAIPRRLPLNVQGRLRQAVVGLALLTGLSAAPCAAPAPKAAGTTVLIVPFDLFDFSLDERPRTVRDLHRWVHELPSQLRRDLSASGRFQVIATRRIRGEWRKLTDSYAHPTTCPSCMVDLGRHAGADYVVVGQVRKLSNLITYYQVQIDRVSTGQTVYQQDSRADGADSDAMWRHIADNVASGIEHSDALSGADPHGVGTSRQ
ncbi:MAG: DUF2380 domain-containing protein [Gammaproteobacteria bacterium]|jgi:hypothetical protein